MTTATHAYVGVKHCGCIVAACVDYADHDTGQHVADMIADGLEVQRVSLANMEDGTVKVFTCRHEGRQMVMAL